MCKYCDVRMLDGCGFEEHGKNEHIMMTLYPDGYAHFACGGYSGSNVDHDSIKFNYCPMCGKPLGDTPEDEDTIYLVQDFNYEDGYYPAYLDKEDAIYHAEEVIRSDNTRKCGVLTARIIKKDTCKLAITWE